MIGNGVTDWTYDTQPATFNMTWEHAIMSDVMREDLLSNECDFSLINFGVTPSGTCMEIYKDFLDLTSGLDMYNIFSPVYKKAEETNVLEPYTVDHKLTAINGHLEAAKNKLTQREYTKWMVGGQEGHKDSALFMKALTSPRDYLNREDVRTLLGVPAENPQWVDCAGSETIGYLMDRKATKWIWEELKGKYRMLKYSGDVDAVVPTSGTLNWIHSLDRDTVKEWKQYQVDGVVGGWTQEFDGLTFATINGAGHMVPGDKPAIMSHLFTNFMAGNDF